MFNLLYINCFWIVSDKWVWGTASYVGALCHWRLLVRQSLEVDTGPWGTARQDLQLLCSAKGASDKRVGVSWRRKTGGRGDRDIHNLRQERGEGGEWIPALEVKVFPPGWEFWRGMKIISWNPSLFKRIRTEYSNYIILIFHQRETSVPIGHNEG